ncbi:hypothetical protein Tsubulata_023175 [Turnera subulata]|uniref:DUF4283 domain-containing protein n=1 Tax=Turnera subulata TaxID=218843 RepID=A0A9Q0FTP7_9ROSI|nr:hypothetical protein Tsubulata_023175 [Turnera subulata]
MNSQAEAPKIIEEEPLQREESRRKVSYREMLAGPGDTPMQEARRDWDDYFEDSESDEDKDEDDECPVIRLSSADKKRLRRPWLRTLFIKVLEKRRFTVDADYERVLYEGPWSVGDHVVAVKRWVPHFDPDIATIDKAVGCVQISKLELAYYDRELLMRVGNRIGKFLRIENATLLASRCNFARICVEVDLTKPLKSKIKIRRRVRRLVYEGLHIYFECGKFGNMKDRCPEAGRDDQGVEMDVGVTELSQEEVIRPEVMNPY